MQSRILLLFLVVFWSCKQNTKVEKTKHKQYITILGTAQDAGYPQIGCKRECCNNFYNGKKRKQHVVSLGLVDKKT